MAPPLVALLFNIAKRRGFGSTIAAAPVFAPLTAASFIGYGSG
jgi:hypothetical protein